MLNLVLGVSLAVIVITSAVLRRVWPEHRRITDAEARARLASLRPGEIPEPLRAATPRPDVFSGRGYLRKKEHKDRYLQLLLRGRVARGVCISYWDADAHPGVDVTWEIAWVDDRGELRREGGQEYCDGMHPGPPGFTGSISVFIEARLKEGRPVTVVYAPLTKTYVIYEALCLDDKRR